LHIWAPADGRLRPISKPEYRFFILKAIIVLKVGYSIKRASEDSLQCPEAGATRKGKWCLKRVDTFRQQPYGRSPSTPFDRLLWAGATCWLFMCTEDGAQVSDKLTAS